MVINKTDNIFIVHIFKEYIDDINIFDIKMMITFFKNILKKIKTKYYIKGLCNIDVYYDKKYGMILEINNYDDEIIELDVNIKFYLDSNFLVEIDNDIGCEYDNIYYYNGKYYTDYLVNSDSKIIYRNTLDIICNGLKIK